MKDTVTCWQMKEIDHDSICRVGIPSMVLMERAALAVAEQVQDFFGSRVLILCGMGNNGGDGIAVGRILSERGYDVTLLYAGKRDHATTEWKVQESIAQALKISSLSVEEFLEREQGWDYQIVVDALFGVGLSRDIEHQERRLLESICRMREEKEFQIVAVDIPSGIHGDTGAVLGIALPADVTVTFGRAKTGHLLYPGKAYTGKLVIENAGFAHESFQQVGYDARYLESSDLLQLPKREAEGNKGTFGKVLIVAGSDGMSGAAYLSALAAYKTGCGLVKILTVPENSVILQTMLPEAIVETYDGQLQDGTDAFKGFLEKQCDWADVIVMGPGMGQEPYVEIMLESVLAYAYVPIILDADGLNVVASHPYLTHYFTENIIITPHPSEMARLSQMTVQGVKEAQLKVARDYSSKYHVVCVLKDAVTVIADRDGNTFINTSGCSAMAKGGSGDVLTGVIAGLIGRGMEGISAAAYGVYIHGLAGEQAEKRYGTDGVLAHHIADCILR